MELIEKETISYDKIIDSVNTEKWKRIKEITVSESIVRFLDTFKRNTRRVYRSHFYQMFFHSLIDPQMNLQQFSLLNLEQMLDNIKLQQQCQEATLQSRAAVFISFCRFLSRRTEGMIRIPAVSKEGINKTFQKIRNKAATRALSLEEWTKFIHCLSKRSPRDAMIARMTLQGAKRINEVLHATIENIDFEALTITFKQSKSKLEDAKTVIHYSKEFMQELKQYLGDRTKGTIFITRTGQPLTHMHIYESFKMASIIAKIRNVSPHCLRATAITMFLDSNYTAEQIQKISGHANLQTVLYYDKRDEAHNISREKSLI
jgi:integrase